MMFQQISLDCDTYTNSENESSSTRSLDAELSPPPLLPPILRRQNAMIILNAQHKTLGGQDNNTFSHLGNQNMSSIPTIIPGEQYKKKINGNQNTYKQRRLSRELYILNNKNIQRFDKIGQQSDNQNYQYIDNLNRQQNMSTIQLPPIIMHNNNLTTKQITEQKKL